MHVAVQLFAALVAAIQRASGKHFRINIKNRTNTNAMQHIAYKLTSKNGENAPILGCKQ